jgi:hypothetical protein
MHTSFSRLYASDTHSFSWSLVVISTPCMPALRSSKPPYLWKKVKKNHVDMLWCWNTIIICKTNLVYFATIQRVKQIFTPTSQVSRADDYLYFIFVSDYLPFGSIVLLRSLPGSLSQLTGHLLRYLSINHRVISHVYDL